MDVEAERPDAPFDVVLSDRVVRGFQTAGPVGAGIGGSRDDWSRDAFPWLSVRETAVGIAPAVVMSVSFSGELAYEVHVPNDSLHAAYLALRPAGEDHGLRLFGSRAIESMRLEKSYLHWKSDILTELDPFETGLDRFVRLDGGDFLGRDALACRRAEGPRAGASSRSTSPATTRPPMAAPR